MSDTKQANRWVLGARPRTLPAAVVPVVVGTASAWGLEVDGGAEGLVLEELLHFWRKCGELRWQFDVLRDAARIVADHFA